MVINRYTLTLEPEKLGQRLGMAVPEAYHPRYNAAPAQLLPVVTAGNDLGISWFYWGLSPQRSQNKSISEKILNRKSEDVSTKPVFKKLLRTHRCLIPMDGFYMWKQIGKKTQTPYLVVLKSRQMFVAAGIWEEFETERDETHHTFSMLTTPTPTTLRSLGERMPCMVAEKDERLWLSPETAEVELIQLLQGPPEPEMEFFTVSPQIEDPDRDSPLLIKPAPAADQFGNLTLFG